ncbi:hypothetical protein M7775_09620 [Sporomusa sphaeroides DSM 2875]|nr:hypothetical protein [Sporomusa sphaeroides]MCM0758822.1 hypothetical protein [Sporomusa sphaeroides DSM 2875]
MDNWLGKKDKVKNQLPMEPGIFLQHVGTSFRIRDFILVFKSIEGGVSQ